MQRSDISIDVLAEWLRYDPETGLIFWKKRSSPRAGEGDIAFSTPHTKGYLKGGFMGKTINAHRVAWALHYGEWPIMEIDHIDRQKDNNRISNLRQVTSSQNNLNRVFKRWQTTNEAAP